MEQGAGIFDVKTTLPILTEEYHTSCTLKSGYNLTMITCTGQFEVYDTQSLFAQKSLITNYGANRQIKGVHNSLAMNDLQSITFLEDRNVTKLYRD